MKYCKLCGGIVWGKQEGDICSVCHEENKGKDLRHSRIVFDGESDKDE